jgi:hypothetical protein
MKDILQARTRFRSWADFAKRGAGFRDDVIRIPGKVEWKNPHEITHGDMSIVQGSGTFPIHAASDVQRA